MKKKQFQIFVMQEGEMFHRPTKKYFSDSKEAWTFANLESAAGMGEDYTVRKRGSKVTKLRR